MAYTTIDDPSAHFQVATWTGDGSSPRTITNDGNSNLQPDWVWHKNLSDSGRSHYSHDSSRGFGAHKEIVPNSTTAENSDSHLTENHGYIASASTDSFVLGAGASNQNYTNKSSSSYVAWQWKANGGTTTSFGESGDNPGGDRQANTTAGFSIIDYVGTGAAGTIAHGLGKVPEMIIFKDRSADGDDWFVYHQGTGNDGGVRLNTNAADGNDSNRFNNTSPTTSVFTVGASGGTNDDGNATIAYCFAPIQGYSKFGTYRGNGNADGPFVYLGFKPKFFMLKNISASQYWYMFDTGRDTVNPSNSAQAIRNTTQETGYAMDFLGNGFKIRHNDSAWNGSGNTFIYMAFAEHPFVSSEGIPVTAR